MGDCWRREQVRCSWQTAKRVLRMGNGSSLVWSGGHNLLKSGSPWPQSLRRQPCSSCLTCWQATAGFLKERPWAIHSASHQSHGISVEADGVNGGSWASQRAGSAQTLVILLLSAVVCLRWTRNAQLQELQLLHPWSSPDYFPDWRISTQLQEFDTFQCSPTADQTIPL